MIEKRLFWGNRVCPMAVLLVFISAAGCAEVRVRTLPAPPPAAKLRVFIKPLTGASGGSFTWAISHGQFEKGILQGTGRILQAGGIYEVIREEDVRSALGGKGDFSRHDWSKKNWALAREAGKALHADYALMVERSRSGEFLFWEMIMIGVETGGQIRSLVRAPLAHGTDYERMFRASYQNFFREAKGDMLATALRKGRLSAPESSAPRVEGPPPKPIHADQRPGFLKPENAIDLEQLLQAEKTVPGRPQLAIYDLATSEPWKIVALILSEALREEISGLGGFTLVNRENIVQVLNEMGLQQTGLVEESQAVKAGRGLAAQQVVLGQFGVLGKTAILQAKRIDVESQRNLAFGSIKSAQGKEEDLLAGLPGLAKNLAGNRK